ncbi:MAG TPA: hypothetical protein VMW73_12870 [Spirochaetia bacterium]|nr:hypothetical protein [Spirochaetia bacterium]
MAKNENEPRRRRGRRRPNREDRTPEPNAATRGPVERAGEKRKEPGDSEANSPPRSGRRRSRRGGRSQERTPPKPKREINADLPREVKFRMPDPPPKREYGVCPICSLPMRDIHSAIAYPPSDQPAHFECVVSRIAEDEHLAPGERVVYLGHGSFGIVQDQSQQGKSRYVVRKRIQFEETERIVGWRKELSPGISRD